MSGNDNDRGRCCINQNKFANSYLFEGNFKLRCIEAYPAASFYS